MSVFKETGERYERLKKKEAETISPYLQVPDLQAASMKRFEIGDDGELIEVPRAKAHLK